MSNPASTSSNQASLYADTPAVAMQVSQGLVVASIQVDLVDSVLERFREELLQRVHTSGCRGVILDLSGLETLDAEEFSRLRSIMDMVQIMGADSVLVGMQAGVVSALIETGADVDGLCTALDLDAAFALFEPSVEAPLETATNGDEEARDHLEKESLPVPQEQQ
jgi:rsbT antagonist protein RsbS